MFADLPNWNRAMNCKPEIGTICIHHDAPFNDLNVVVIEHYLGGFVEVIHICDYKYSNLAGCFRWRTHVCKLHDVIGHIRDADELLEHFPCVDSVKQSHH
jgi:hypothetical protein